MYQDTHLTVKTCRCFYIRDWSKAIPKQAFWRFYWNPDPGAWIRHNQHTVRLRADISVAIPPGIAIDRGLKRAVRSLAVHATLTPFQQVPQRLLALKLAPHMQQELTTLLTDHGQDVALDIQRSHLLSAWMHALLAQARADEWQQQMHNRFTDCIQAMHRQLNKRWRNPELARLCHMSTNAFIRAFRRDMGASPQRYLTELRLQHAAVLLRQADTTINAIAQACGFTDRYHFSRCFKDAYGIPPAQYREAPNI